MSDASSGDFRILMVVEDRLPWMRERVPLALSFFVVVPDLRTPMMCDHRAGKSFVKVTGSPLLRPSAAPGSPKSLVLEGEKPSSLCSPPPEDHNVGSSGHRRANMALRSRELSNAYRAVYLASPLKFCTTLHSFSRVVPRYYINAWEKNPYKWQHHKYHRVRQRQRGKWCYLGGPMSGVQIPGWPEPSLLSPRALVDTAQRAQVERLEDKVFWQQVAERTVQLRDIMDVGDLAVIVDTLLTANHRHTHLMKTISRELIEDVDKLSLVETAVILNAYAHFNCVSEFMLKAFAEHVARLLLEQPYTTLEDAERYGAAAADPQTLAVLCKAFASLRYKDSEMLKAVNSVLLQRIEDSAFGSVAEVLTAFAELDEPFEAPIEFWMALASKVPGSQMRFLCPTLRAAQRLEVAEPALFEALGQEVVAGLQGLRVSAPLEDAMSTPMPAFAEPQLVTQLSGKEQRTEPASVPAEDLGSLENVDTDVDDNFQVVPVDAVIEDGIVEEDIQDDENRAVPKRRRRWWYNAVTRKLDSTSSGLPEVPYFAPWNPDECFRRNQRGARVAQALEGLDSLQRAVASSTRSPSSPSSGPSAPEDAPAKPVDVELLENALPLLSGSLQGLSPAQLALCAERFADAPGRGTTYLFKAEKGRSRAFLQAYQKKQEINT
ncbi:unnamed protein product [Symbiodinium sp. KB8]|nr:unnamed protein product [Symbiodinium sp. KB8]